MDVIQINVEARESLGRKSSKAARAAGKIPAVIYSKSNGVSHFTTTHGDVKKMVYTPEFKMAEINIGGASKKAIIKAIDFHPVTDEIVHIDFLELVDGHPLVADIPVNFTGESPGVKEGGKLIRTLRKVTVKTTPENLVDNLYVSIDGLELGSAVRVRDIDVPDGVQIMVNEAMPIANVIVPRALKSGDDDLEEGAEGEGSEGAEGEGGETEGGDKE